MPEKQPPADFNRPPWLTRWIKKAWKWLHSLRATPKEVALGAALGIFVALTPTIGLQCIIALALATLFRASRPAAILTVFITNPATIPAIFLAAYRVGTIFWDGPPARQVFFILVRLCKHLSTLRLFAFWESFLEFIEIGRGVLIPMWIGGLILGTICGALTYPLVLWGMRGFHQLRVTRRERRLSRRKGSRSKG